VLLKVATRYYIKEKYKITTLKPPQQQQDNTLPNRVLDIGQELHWPK
jgi:hypothetical protein